ncbi:hypothetical protein PTTG_25503 [Puccinia triticina 1-1 BBBD Race 1]|uniref:Uncharacterized protein n=1 Tax=Puccinia triticina (isolate 1-1 / race 1 (BBBD)) TaxID=630390 RepID=A0A180H2C5_PUCT1|nr:hypothetical protein PTTG_25503 [Puccinia triticina 1-1 BBBD Race 1]
MKGATQVNDTMSKYKAILSNVPEIIEPGDVHVTKSSTVNDTPAETVSTIMPVGNISTKSDRELIWDKATLALEKGDKASVEFYLRVYGKMKTDTSLLVPDKPDILRSTSSDAVNPSVNLAKKPVDKTTIVFVKGSLPKHFDVGFTPYFNQNIREFRGPIPLTIFDKKWQKDAIQYYTNRRSRGDEKDGNYIGYEDLYNYTEFAEWILLHKENVDKIVSEEGFMTAFRYDMIVRQNAFSYQVTTETGAVSAVNISMFWDDVKREAWCITLTLDEHEETDNPYAYAGEKFGYDPNTGKPRVKNGNEDQRKNRSSSSSHGRGGFRGRGSGDRWSQDRRNSDYGGYRGGYHDHKQSDDGYYKRPRDQGYLDHDFDRNDRNSDAGFGQRGGYGRERGGYGKDQGHSRNFRKKDNTTSSTKDKEN